MATSVYASRFVPVLKAAAHDQTDYSGNFQREMGKRFLRVLNLVNGTQVLQHVSGYGLLEKGGEYSVVEITKQGGPYLIRGVHHSGNVEVRDGFEIVAEGDIRDVELGIFSGDREFVDGVRARMETGLPDWIAVREVERLFVWSVEEIYAIAAKRRQIFR